MFIIYLKLQIFSSILKYLRIDILKIIYFEKLDRYLMQLFFQQIIFSNYFQQIILFLGFLHLKSLSLDQLHVDPHFKWL